MKADIAMCFLILLLRSQDLWDSILGPEDSTLLEVWPIVLSSTRQQLSQYFKICRGMPSSCFRTPRYVHPLFHATKYHCLLVIAKYTKKQRKRINPLTLKSPN